MSKLLFKGTEWDIPLVEKIWNTIDHMARTQFGLDYYPPQIEIITSEQMLNNYSSHAMPIMYPHWSFGKTFLQNEREYNKGIQGLAYEVVINTNPCIAYLMENNTATLQTLVLAHASCGHSHFFKNNYLFKGWTDAESILDYLKFARNYIKQCEEKYGTQRVEALLDACHSLQAHSVDKYKKPARLSEELKKQRQKQRDNYSEAMFNDLWRTIPKSSVQVTEQVTEQVFPEENILYFIEKNSPILEDWEKEIVRIVRKIAQYFYPQRQTGLLNEGFACFVHFMLMTELHEQGFIDEGSYLEFLQSHTNVVTQRDWDHKGFRGINVYALGFAVLMDIKRACTAPDDEDYKWLTSVCNTEWLDTIKDIVANYRDESFILQFLSPKVARQFKLFSFHIKQNTPYLAVNATHDDESFLALRKVLSEQYDMNNSVPQIEIVEVDWYGDRRMYLEHTTKNNLRLAYRDTKRTLECLQYLWGFPISIEYKDIFGKTLNEV